MSEWKSIEYAPKNARFIGAREFGPDGLPVEVWAVSPCVFYRRGRKVVEYFAGKQRVFPKVWVEMPTNYKPPNV